MPLYARDLWLKPTGWPRPMYRGALRRDGRMFVTDRVIVLYCGQLDDCADIPAPTLLTPAQAIRLGRPLLLPAQPHPSPAVFRGRHLQTLEDAGYLVRPLADRGKPHAITRDGLVVGLLMPMAQEWISPTLDRTAR